MQLYTFLETLICVQTIIAFGTYAAIPVELENTFASDGIIISLVLVSGCFIAFQIVRKSLSEAEYLNSEEQTFIISGITLVTTMPIIMCAIQIEGVKYRTFDRFYRAFVYVTLLNAFLHIPIAAAIEHMYKEVDIKKLLYTASVSSMVIYVLLYVCAKDVSYVSIIIPAFYICVLLIKIEDMPNERTSIAYDTKLMCYAHVLMIIVFNLSPETEIKTDSFLVKLIETNAFYTPYVNLLLAMAQLCCDI